MLYALRDDLAGDLGITVNFQQETLGLNCHLIKIVATIECAQHNKVYYFITNYY
ncbi:hypothetical protein PsB1_1988 [Candidatus Phycosocius spiralis]|uniref:Uncharacterized protein n=1 Tax=Candidatus Phycosocius spiralis TaxID=2815099 RepID=A0ABQ4PXY1_9PROT|nr:hypothetical protein PsB1_1988 [Candidatus Phycosocius spiralis]